MPPQDLNSLLAPAQPEMRRFDDYSTIRRNILDGVRKAVAARFPLSNSRYTVEAADVDYAGAPEYTLKDQQKALMQGQSLYTPLRGHLVMKDNATGAVIDQTDKPVTLARVPYLTPRGTFISNGSEYVVTNQSRLLPGPFVRRRKSGEYEAHFNTLPGKGRGFRMALMPDTGKFVVEIGQSVAPAYPMFRALGVTDDELEKTWGKDLLASSKEGSAYDAGRIYERLTNEPSKDLDENTIYSGIRTALESTVLDPEVTRRTLGYRAKAASVPIRGTLRIDSEGYITVPSGLIDGVYYALRDSDKAPGIAKGDGRLTVIEADEIKKLRKVFRKDFEATCGSGRRFTYDLVKVLPPMSGEYCVEIECPELEQLRRSLLLDPKPRGGFRLSVGVKAAADLNTLMETKEAAPVEIGPMTPVDLTDDDFGKISGRTLLRASQKILNAQKGLEDQDDRDSLAYQKFLGPEDFFSERIEKDAGGILRTALFKATNRGNLEPLKNGVFTPALNGVLMGSGLGAPIEEVNPMEILDQNMRVIRTGEGGISSGAHGIPIDSRSVQPSHFGFIDPVRTPESSSVGVDLRLTVGAIKGTDGQLYSRLRDPRTGEVKPVPARQVTDSIVAFPGELAKAAKTGDMVRAMVGGEISYVDPKAVQFELPSHNAMFNVNSNLVPGVSGIKGGRLLMGSKYFTQALPVRDAESPLVQGLDSEDPEGRAYEEQLQSALAAVTAEKELGPGVVTAVDPDFVEVKHGKTKRRYETYNNFPFNRKCVKGSTKVWILRGDRRMHVRADQYAFAAGDLIRSIDPETCRSSWEPVTAFVELTNDRRMVQVRTRGGRTVVVTEDHSLVTMGEDGKLVPLYPDECVVGTTRLPVCAMDNPKDSVDKRDSHEWGLLAGIYLAEGHVPPSQPNMVILAVKDASRRAELEQLIVQLGLKPHDNKADAGKVSFTSSEVASWLVAEFGHGSAHKCPSERAFDRSEAFRHGLVAGYFAGDGCLHEDSNGAVQLEAWTTSRAMRDALIDLLSGLGVFSTVLSDRQLSSTNPNWADAYGLRVISTHLAKLDKWFLYSDRNLKLSSLRSSSYRTSVFEFIPLPAKSRQLVYAGFEHDVPMRAYKDASAGKVSRQNARGPFEAWAKSDVMWDIVEEVVEAPAEERVYDFTVANSHVFAVNCGLVIHNTFLHNTAMVKVGDQVQPGQLLAKSNYTDDKGRLAMGKNLRVAYTVWGDPELGGANFEDGVVMSKTAAEKMSSEHMYTIGYDSKDDYSADYSRFVSLFPGVYSQEQLKAIDAGSGVVKVGTMVNPGDPVILGVGERQGDTFGLVKRTRPAYSNRAQTWDHSQPGVVTDVTRTRSGWQVAIKSYKPMGVGDKLVGRYGDKGVVSAVVDDKDMPQDKDGNPYEIAFNPLALTSRVNPVQAVEAALGKIAVKTGVPYKLPAFVDESYIDMAQRELKKNGLTDTETLFDPRLGRNIEGIFTGNRYFMNLHHQAEKKLTARDLGGYSTEEAPVKGGEEGAKRISISDINALLAHGAIDVIKDARLVRGQKNDEYWRAVKMGTPVPAVNVPFVWDKFVSQLKGAGVNVERQGGAVNIYGMTGSDVKKLSGGEIQDPRDIDFRTGKAYDGGFFDDKIFGTNQSKFGHFPLAAKVVNPVMEDAVRSLMGFTKKDLERVISGEKVKGVDGMAGLEQRLGGMDLKAEAEMARKEIATARGQRRSNAISRLSYLEGMTKRNLKPSDFLWEDMPVLPPRFRPITDTGNMQMVADMNYLYKELFGMNRNLKDLQGELGQEASGKERLALYNMVKATVGLADPASAKLRQKNVNGLIRHILGSNPKFSMFQRKVLSSTVEGVGNAVITPDPSLDMDHVGVPEDMAYSVFRPYVVRALVASGASPLEAMKQVESRTPTANRALLAEMQRRPVMITRAPVLHKYNFMAARPVLTAGPTLRLSPSVVVGFNADFDGDQMRLHVPSTQAAVDEAYRKMLPSRNLLSAATFQAQPFIKNEFLYGLYLASRQKADKNVAKTFRTREDAIKAFNRGEVSATDTVRILE